MHSATQPVMTVLNELTAFTFTAGGADDCPMSNISSGVTAQYTPLSMIVNCLASSVTSKSVTATFEKFLLLKLASNALLITGRGTSPTGGTRGAFNDIVKRSPILCLSDTGLVA